MPDCLQRQLETMAGQTPARRVRRPRSRDLGATSATGLSSDTILFTAAWDDGSGRAARTTSSPASRPTPVDVPVFPSYDLERQFRVIDDVGRLSPVPVPDVVLVRARPAARRRAVLRHGTGRRRASRPT